MSYEILRLSSGWLVTVPLNDTNITSKFVTSIDEAFDLIRPHAEQNAPPCFALKQETAA